MADELGELSTQDAGSLIGGILAEDGYGTEKDGKAEDGEYREVKFKAKAKPAKAKADPASEKAAEKPADEDVVAEDESPYKDEDGKEQKDAKKEPTKDDETDEEEEKPEPRLVKVKVDGQEVEVDEEELKKGYSRTGDYTRKTQALAEEKRKFVEEELAPVRAERQLYAERLEALHTAVLSLLPETEPDWNEVRTRTTPEEFTEAFAQWKVQQQRVEKIKAEQSRVADLQRKDNEKLVAVRLDAERQKLLEALPELKDPDKGKGLRDDLSAYARSLGFTEEGLAAVEDHRLLVMLDKARRWDEAQRRKPKVEEKIERALDTIKPSSPKSVPRPKEMERAKARLAESGRIDDAADLISKML